MVRIFRVYNNGSVKEETYVLKPHKVGVEYSTGYGGNVDAWSTHNQKYRFGCAQFKWEEGEEEPVCIYNGYLDAGQIAKAIQDIKEK